MGTSMTCSLCIKHQRRPIKCQPGRATWVDVPCTSIRRASLALHQESDSHKEAMVFETAATLTGGIEAGFVREQTVNRLALITSMKVLYFLCREEIPHTTKYNKFIDLLKGIGCDVLHKLEKGENAKYTSERHVQDLVVLFGDTVWQKICSNIKKSPFYSVMVDETTDVEVLKQLIIYIRYVSNGKSLTSYAQVIDIPDGKAVTIKNAIVHFLDSNEIPLSHMCALGSDGASVMVGRKGGVAALLRQEVPHLLNNHCVAHRLALASAQAAASVPYMKRFKSTITHLYLFYHYSAVRAAGLKEIQSILNEPKLKLTEAKDVRWLSHDKAIQSIRRCLPAVVTSLEREASERDEPQAAGLSLFVQTYKFVATLHLMSDVLPILSSLSRAFQLKDGAFSMVRTLVSGAIATIKALREEPGEHFARLPSVIDSLCEQPFRYRQPTETEKVDYRKSVYLKFIDAVVENLEARFPDLPLLESFSIFNPQHWVDDDHEPSGTEDVKILAEHFAGFVNADDVLAEFSLFQNAVRDNEALRDATTHRLMEEAAGPMREVLPNLAKLAAAGLVIPTSTADMAFMDPFEGHAESLHEFTANMMFVEDGVGLDMLEVAIPTTPEKPTNHGSLLHEEDGLLNFTPDDCLLNFMNEFGLPNFVGDDMLLNFMEEDGLPSVTDVLDVPNEHVGVANDLMGLANNHVGVANDHVGGVNNCVGMANDHVGVPNDYVGVANKIDLANGGFRQSQHDMSVAKNNTGMANSDIGVANRGKGVANDMEGVVNNVAQIVTTKTENDISIPHNGVKDAVNNLANEDLCIPIDTMGMAGIEASDVGSLLEQFEEVSHAIIVEPSISVSQAIIVEPSISAQNTAGETAAPTVSVVEEPHTVRSQMSAPDPSVTAIKAPEIKRSMRQLAISKPVVTYIERATTSVGDTTSAQTVPDRGEFKSVTSSGILAVSVPTVAVIVETETDTDSELATSAPMVVGVEKTVSAMVDQGLTEMQSKINHEMIEKDGNLMNILDPEDNCLEKLQKLKSSVKRKTAVIIPMAVPAKRGRGRAMARGHPVPMPANCAPLRLQRVMMQNKELRDSIPLVGPEIDTTWKKKAKTTEKVNVDDNYFELANDHDYCTNGITPGKAAAETPEDNNNNVKFTDANCDVMDDANLEKFKKVDTEQQQNKRSYRRQHGSPKVDSTQYFDKLPSYYTALSIPQKSIKKSASNVTLTSNSSVHDLIERDHSPVRDPSMYNKVPDYHSSFTNSTKYDIGGSYSDRGCEFSQESKISSGYSSRSDSPLVIDSRRASRAQSVASTGSHSVASSGSRSSSSSCCTDCSCGDGSRSRSRESQGSQGHPRSLGSRSRSRSRSYSSCSSHYSSRSADRGWKRERKMRHKRSRRRRSSSRSPYHDSRSRSYSRSTGRHVDGYSRRDRSPSHYSQSRSGRYKSPSRSRDYSRRPRSQAYRSRSRSRGYRSRSRSRSYTRAPPRRRNDSRQRHRDLMEKQRSEDKKKQNDQRRIMYVGNLPESYTRRKLRQRFEHFGDIEHVQLHFREHGDNYGFVTFQYTCDAYAAIEKGNTVPGELKFDLCFGGRRQFCDVDYADLDGNKEVEEEYEYAPLTGTDPLDFDQLLKQAQRKNKKS